MKYKKNFEVADILELIKISNEFIERNRKIYERLAAGIPTQGILDSLIPELIDLYGDHAIQINQYESDTSYIALAVLVTDDYDIPTHMTLFDRHQRLLEKYNDQYGDATLSITEYRYSAIINPEVHNSQAHAIRKGKMLWKRADKRYILNSLIPELIHIYGDYIMQIVQYEASLADISLAILTRSDLDDYDRALFYRQRQGIEKKYNDMYEVGTLNIIEYNYDPVINQEAHDPVADMLRGGDVLWKRGGKIKVNKEKEKTAEELAYYVKSDLDIENIVGKFKHDLQELDYGNRVAAIRKAVEHLNQGCTVNYVADGLREWYGITMDIDELKNLLLQSKDLLPEEERKGNIDKNLLSLEMPEDGKKIDLSYLQHKYKKGYHYIDALYKENIFPYSGSDLCEALYFQAVCNLCKDRSEIDEYFKNLKREREAAREKEEQSTE